MLKRSRHQVRNAPKKLGQAQAAAFSKLQSSFAAALAHHQAGRLVEAEGSYHQILTVHPDHFDSRHLLGVVFLQRGANCEALRHIDLALTRSPDNVAALNNRAVALQGLGRYEEALAAFDRAIALRPDYAEAHSNRANVLKTLKRLTEALASYDRAIALRAEYAEAYANRADALFKLKRFEEALASADRALLYRPHYPEAFCNRGNALHELKRFDEALASYDDGIALRPEYSAAHCNRGNSLHEQYRYDEALASHDRALALQSDFVEAHSNRGNVLQELRRFTEALASYDRAIALRPDFAEAYMNRGNALVELQRFPEALADFDRAVALRPDFAEAHFSAALCRLLNGDLPRGFEQYEWRWQTDQLRREKPDFPQPPWDGTNSVAGKTLLVHAEQGFGDTIQFCRYVPLLVAHGARMILEVQNPLCELMHTLAGDAQIVARGDPLPDFDMHCPLLSLPLALGTQLESIPAATPYLFAQEAKSAAWRSRMDARERFRVGLVWAGDPRKRLPNAHRIDRQRSIAFEQLAPLIAATECEFYSLQKGEYASAQLRNSPLRQRIIDWTRDLNDFSDTAALIDNLDLVIAVDTSVAHLAGAMGKPLWLLNRHNTCWRWLLAREDSPWYPTMRIFRQPAMGDWDGMLERLRGELVEVARRQS